MSGQDLIGAVALVAYYMAFAAAIGLLTQLVDFPKELARKTYHVMCSLSILILLFTFENWYAATTAISVLLLIAFVVLNHADKIPFASFSIDRGNGISEIGEHLLFMLISMVVLMAMFWGMLGDDYRYVVVVGMLTWGFGDSSASIFGRRYARRRLKAPIFDPHKSLEGSSAMVAASTLTCFVVLYLMVPLPLAACIFAAVLLGLLAGVVEAATHRGLDTLTVPLITGFSAWPIVSVSQWLLGGAA